MGWWGMVALGAGLRLWQYCAHASQWVDELALSRSIVELPLAALLTGPLLFGQVAPPGFLLLERIAVAIAGPNDFALRLVPLAASLAALVLFLRLAILLRLRPATVTVALALFALQPELIRYAAQVKPYAVDVAVTLALTLLVGDLLESEPAAIRRAAGVGAAGVLAVLLSHAAVLTLAGLAFGLVLATLASGRRRNLAAVALTLGLWALAAVGALTLAHRAMTPRMTAYLHTFWASAFAPWPPELAADARWAVGAVRGEIGAAGMEYPWPALYAGLAVLGFLSLWRRQRTLCLVLLGPLAAVLGAAGAGLYPFASRLVLSVVPALVLAIAAGAETLANLAVLPFRSSPGQGSRLAAAAGGALIYAAVLAPAALAFASDPPVYRYEETRPILAGLAARRHPGDSIYAYYGAGQALRFYGPEYGITPDQVLLGGCHRGDTRAYLHELDRFRGRPRLWVLITHAHPALAEQDSILTYLDHLGTRRLTLRADPHGHKFGRPALAFLYDLSTAPRLAGDDAATFPLPPAPHRVDPHFACFGSANPVPEEAAAAATP